MVPAPQPRGSIDKPVPNDVRRGDEIGCIRKGDNKSYIWHACPDCGEAKWAIYQKGEPNRTRCKKCADRHHRIVTAIPKGTIEKPSVGDIRVGAEIGFNNHHSHIWRECPNCETLIWRPLAKLKRG